MILMKPITCPHCGSYDVVRIWRDAWITPTLRRRIDAGRVIHVLGDVKSVLWPDFQCNACGCTCGGDLPAPVHNARLLGNELVGGVR